MTHLPIRLIVLAGLSMLVLAACGTQTTRSDGAATNAIPNSGATESAQADKVGQRAIERWDYLIKRDAAKAYDYLSPGSRATKSRDDYAQEMNNRPVRWTKVYPRSQTCDKPDVCKVILMIEYEAMLPGASKPTSAPAFINETWIKDGGEWWFLPGAITAQRGK